MEKLTASDGGANFGYSVAIDVDTIVVGASAKSSGQGTAYVYLSGPYELYLPLVHR